MVCATWRDRIRRNKPNDYLVWRIAVESELQNSDIFTSRNLVQNNDDREFVVYRLAKNARDGYLSWRMELTVYWYVR